jgi:phosphoglycerol transferase MdoB-like AlkP superfamily enzyme
LKSNTNIHDTKPSQPYREGSVIWQRGGPAPKRTSLTRKFFIFLSLTAAVFIALTLYTAKLERAFDGLDLYGFPFRFLIKYPGMCDPCPDDLTDMSWWKFLFDIGFAFVLVLIFRKAVHISKHRIKKPVS